METISTARFETQLTVKHFACKLQESMSKFSEGELINRILSNIQQVCHIIEFKINQEIDSHAFIFANELKEN